MQLLFNNNNECINYSSKFKVCKEKILRKYDKGSLNQQPALYKIILQLIILLPVANRHP